MCKKNRPYYIHFSWMISTLLVDSSNIIIVNVIVRNIEYTI